MHCFISQRIPKRPNNTANCRLSKQSQFFFTFYTCTLAFFSYNVRLSLLNSEKYYAGIAQLVGSTTLPRLGSRVRASFPAPIFQQINTIFYAGIAQLVEHNLAKVGVASSSLVSRSKFSYQTQNNLFFLTRFFTYKICF